MTPGGEPESLTAAVISNSLTANGFSTALNRMQDRRFHIVFTSMNANKYGVKCMKPSALNSRP